MASNNYIVHAVLDGVHNMLFIGARNDRLIVYQYLIIIFDLAIRVLSI